MNELNLAINFAKDQFNFLIEEGYQLSERDAPPTYFNYEKHYVLYYEGHDKLIELALRKVGENVECVVRRKICDGYALYNDNLNCLSAFKLSYHDQVNSQSDMTFSAFNLEQRKALIALYASILKKREGIIFANTWFDMDKIKSEEAQYYLKKKGIDILSPKKNKPLPYILTEKTSFLLTEGYHIIEDSDLLPPYQRLGWHIIYGNGVNVINIHQADWRDYYYIFVITINGKKVFEAQAADYKNLNDMADHFVYILKEYL